MKLRQYSLAAVLAATLAAAGCSTSPTNAQIGTGVGAVAGVSKQTSFDGPDRSLAIVTVRMTQQ